MKKIMVRRMIFFILFFSVFAELQRINLSTPNKESKVSYITALQNRKSNREFSEKDLRLQDLSDLLWAAGGLNGDSFVVKFVVIFF
jgi:hypothetical protein